MYGVEVPEELLEPWPRLQYETSARMLYTMIVARPYTSLDTSPSGFAMSFSYEPVSKMIPRLRKINLSNCLINATLLVTRMRTFVARSP
jgi:hypothetical protein